MNRIKGIYIVKAHPKRYLCERQKYHQQLVHSGTDLETVKIAEVLNKFHLIWEKYEEEVCLWAVV